MSKTKAYKEQEPAQQKASEPFVAYGANVVTGNRDDVKSAITGEELLNKLRPRIKVFLHSLFLFLHFFRILHKTCPIKV